MNETSCSLAYDIRSLLREKFGPFIGDMRVVWMDMAGNYGFSFSMSDGKIFEVSVREVNPKEKITLDFNKEIEDLKKEIENIKIDLKRLDTTVKCECGGIMRLSKSYDNLCGTIIYKRMCEICGKEKEYVSHYGR